jgi:hypothetical protein
MSNPIVEKLRIGMTMQELVQLLGQPSNTNPGNEILGGQVTGISTSPGDMRDQLSRTLFAAWNRPEGIYMLTLVDDRLDHIYRAPGYVEPPPAPLVRKGSGQRDICAKCGTSLQARVIWWRTPRPGVVKIGSEGGLFLWCNHCQHAICGRCGIDLGQSCGCPFCKNEMEEFGDEQVKALLK